MKSAATGAISNVPATSMEEVNSGIYMSIHLTNHRNMIRLAMFRDMNSYQLDYNKNGYNFQSR